MDTTSQQCGYRNFKRMHVCAHFQQIVERVHSWRDTQVYLVRHARPLPKGLACMTLSRQGTTLQSRHVCKGAYGNSCSLRMSRALPEGVPHQWKGTHP